MPHEEKAMAEAKESLGPPIAGRKVEPLPCPFCGAAREDCAPAAADELFHVVHDGRSAWQLQCVLCGARGPSLTKADAGDLGIAVAVVDAWNQRTQP